MPGPEPKSDPASRAAMLLLQLAAAQAEIGPFAREGRETPLAAARLYAIAAARRQCRTARSV